MVGAGAARTDLQTNDTHFLLRALVFFFFFFSLNHAPASARFICNFFALIIFFSFLASDYADSALCISDTKLMGGWGKKTGLTLFPNNFVTAEEVLLSADGMFLQH